MPISDDIRQHCPKCRSKGSVTDLIRGSRMDCDLCGNERVVSGDTAQEWKDEQVEKISDCIEELSDD